MMHITDLDVYRSPIHLNFNRILREHNSVPYNREWDDQIAVTIPAAFENPEKVCITCSPEYSCQTKKLTFNFFFK